MVEYTVRRIVVECSVSFLFAAILSVVAGLLLEQNLEKILRVSFLIALVPPVNDMGGNIGCIVGARMGTVLHLASVRGRVERREVMGNVRLGILSGITSFAVTSAILFAVGAVWKIYEPARVALLLLAAGGFQTCVAVFTAVILSLIAFREGLDPDNVVAPIVTSICDISGVASVFLAATLLGL